MTQPRTGRPPRADAVRNRLKVLEAAEAVFDARGTTASTEEVARAAGVGIGTVFRHFPTKETLLEAVYVSRLRKLAEEAGALASADDPGVAFFAFFTRVVGHAATKNALSAALTEAGVDVRDAAAETGQGLKQALATLLSRAQEAGAVRGDVGLPEVMTLLVGASQAAERADVEVRDRALNVVFDGLRAHR
ncbi:TetR/AcrR family transcriptional regulator [Actinoallomurus acaciae]|uniref:TetR/AcrR family transcriptional regulator n=1 Tax=Actinoallomurus acaciae TaxID=502577 RepID=A0ABV5YMV7_9ACTN